MRDETPKQPPTITMRGVTLDDGSYGVELLVSGLRSQEQVEATIAHMQFMFCDSEIKSQ